MSTALQTQEIPLLVGLSLTLHRLILQYPSIQEPSPLHSPIYCTIPPTLLSTLYHLHSPYNTTCISYRASYRLYISLIVPHASKLLFLNPCSLVLTGSPFITTFLYQTPATLRYRAVVITKISL